MVGHHQVHVTIADQVGRLNGDRVRSDGDVDGVLERPVPVAVEDGNVVGPAVDDGEVNLSIAVEVCRR